MSPGNLRLLLCRALTVLAFLAAPAAAFDAGKAAVDIRVRGQLIPYRVFAIQAMPGETLEIEATALPEGGARLVGESLSMPLDRDSATRWTAPSEPGLVRLRLEDAAGDRLMDLNVLVMVPLSRMEGDRLNGYRIGHYPARPFRDLPAYSPPRGLVEVTPELVDLQVSPHFKLGQFLCKQAGGFPKYVLVRGRLLLKLEYLLQLVHREGYEAETFAVLSGFRTPYYNRAIGNVPNSRHQWGGAADIFIDQNPEDGVMDDLNGDGRIDAADADLLYDLFEEVSRGEAWEGFVGGLGKYGTTSNHGPFVHVDARGYRARWGR